MHTRFVLAATLVGGMILFVLGWLTAAILPPRYQPFRDPRAVVEVIRANAPDNAIYAAPQGLFVVVALRPDLSNRLQSISPHLAGQIGVELAIASCLAIVLLCTPIRSPLGAGGFLGLIGLAAGIEVNFPLWNWSGFPLSHLLAGSGYLAANWFVVGLVLGALRLKLDRQTRADPHPAVPTTTSR